MSSWSLVEEVMEPRDAFALISNGAEWMFHQCGSGLVRQGDARAEALLAYAYEECVSERQRQRLFDRGKRKHRMPTVVMAERWDGPDGASLVVFREDGPYLLPRRERPDRLD